MSQAALDALPAVLAALVGTALVSLLLTPLAIRYAFFEHERPDVLVEVGTPHAAGALPRFQAELEGAVRRLAEVKGLEGFSRVVAGGMGVAERWDTVRGRAPSA